MDSDGYFSIVDRKKDLIIRGGYNVYPREIEEVLYGGGARRAASARLASGSRGMQAASRLMLATSANAVGMRAEARRLLEDVIADLTAWTMVTQRMRAQDRPFLHDDAIAEFETAERLLAGQRTLAAGAELARLYQYRGQAAFFDTDWPQAGLWLTKAESVVRSLGLLPDLAFILSYQGLALIQAARRSGPAAYDQAARLFTEARELFRRESVPAFIWQTAFYQALCDIAAGRWPGADDAQCGWTGPVA